jgi:hypothetical protein
VLYAPADNPEKSVLILEIAGADAETGAPVIGNLLSSTE